MANSNDGVYVFDSGASRSLNGIDPGLLALLNQNGGFGGNGNWIWILFLWMMWGGNGFGNGMNGGGAGFISNQLNNNQGRDLLLQALNGRADALGQIAQITNTGVETVKNGIFALQNAINQVGSQVGMSGLQTINALQLGNANLSQQLCECCCNMRYDLAQQTNTLQAQAASNFANQQLQTAQNHAATQLQMAQIESADQLAVCQQTNTLATQNDRNTNSILGAIQAQTTAMTKEFCDLKERELQNKIDTQGDIITQLRGQISNDKQTETFTAAFNALNEKINILSAKSPNTVPVVYPNLTAVNNTPYGGSFNPWGYGFGGQSYWG